MTIEETLSTEWEFWCYFERVKRNKNDGSEVLLEASQFFPSTTGITRIGEKISKINSSEEMVERYLTAIKPNINRMCKQDFPSDASLELLFMNHLLNAGEAEIKASIKPFANSSGTNWTSDTSISYYDIRDYYVPFDMTATYYNQNINDYKKTKSVDLSGNKVLFEDLELLLWKFMKGQTIGFTIGGTGGFCSLYGPNYDLYFLRPMFTIDQIVTARMQSNLNLDTEIITEGKIKGICTDKDGVKITGKQCRIIAYDMDKYDIVGTGLSSAATGEYLISVTSKIGQPIVVSFLNEVDDITGSEIMTTLSRDASL